MSHLHIPDGVLPPVVWLLGTVLAGLLLLATGRFAHAPGPQGIAYRSALGGIMLAVMAVPVPITAFDYCMTLAGPVGVLLGAAGAFQVSFVVTFILALMGQGGFTVVGLNTLVLAAGAALARPLYRTLVRRTSPAVAMAAATAVSQLASSALWVALLALSVRLSPGAMGEHEVAHALAWFKGGTLALVLVPTLGVAIGVEALLGFGLARFLDRVRPDLLPGPFGAAAPAPEGERAVINTFAQVDFLASAGRSPWHRASAITKLVTALAAIGAAVFVTGWPALAVLLATALALTLTAQLPPRLVLAAATAPLVFALLFVAASWHGRIDTAIALGLRPVIASLMALWLVGTTPYPDLFAPLSRLMPRAAGDSLFLTYRAVFSLLGRVERLWKALFLRGAMQGPVRRRASMMGEAVGTVVLYGFERSHRLYQVMHLRGHSGRICGCRHWLDLRPADIAVIAVLLWVLACAFLLSGRGMS